MKEERRRDEKEKRCDEMKEERRRDEQGVMKLRKNEFNF
jgi:hypothetical protein